MDLKKITSYDHLLKELKGKDKTFLLLYKEGSEISDCAYRNIVEAVKGTKELNLFMADVSNVRDIHDKYSVTSVPTLLVFEKGQMINTIKGCHDNNYFKSIFESLVPQLFGGDNRPRKNVVVYSTPSCSWCATLKTHLRKNGVSFRDIDISRDQHAAEELVRRSGQQGVPQTEIDGQIIVGFDRDRINEMLGI